MAECYDARSSNNEGRRDTTPMETDTGTATDHLITEIHRIIELVDPARGELTKLKNAPNYRQDNKMQQDSNKTFELQKQLHVARERNSKLTEEVEKFQTLYQTTSKDLKAANTTIQKCEMSMRAQEDDHKKKIDAYKEVHSNFENQLILKSDEIEELKSSKADLSKQFKALKRDKEGKITRLDESIKQLKVEKFNVEKELSETKSRLSKLMGDKLSNNNPDIADLSDDHRPTKLAEKYQELYDNQWTDAFEKAEEFFLKETEKTRITVLYRILQNVYQFCKDEVVKQDTDLMTAMFRTHQTKELNSDIPENIQTKIKELKRYAVSKSTDNLLEKFLGNCDKTNKIGQFTENSRDFVNECINLCWHMVNQNPPVVLHLNVRDGDKFDGNMYKHYTMTGIVVDFVVWPALLLFENGSVLSKGVVQCAKLPQGSKSMRTRSKKVNATEMCVPTGSLKLTNTMAEVNVADLPQNMSRKATPKSPSELNQNHGKVIQRSKTSKPETVRSEISMQLALPTDKTEDSVQHEQLHHSRLNTDNKQVNSSPDNMITKSQCHDESQTPQKLSTKQPNDDVVKYRQTSSEDVYQNESASDYVQQYQQHDDCSKQSQSNTANIQQSQPNAGDVMHTRPKNMCNNYPYNDNNNQQYLEQFQQYQSNTGISRRQQQHQQQHQQHQQQQQQQHQQKLQQQLQNISSIQSNAAVGQNSVTHSSGQAMYGSQHQQQHQQHQQQQQQQQHQQQLPQCQPQQQQLQNISSLQSNAAVGQNSVTQSSGQAMYGSQYQQSWITAYPYQQEYEYFIRNLNYVDPFVLRRNMGAQAYDRCMNSYLISLQKNWN